MGGNGNQFIITGGNGNVFIYYYRNGIGMGIRPWEWEGMGLKIIPAHP